MADSAHLDASADAGDDFRPWCVLEADLKEVVMSANTKVLALGHAMHAAHTWVSEVAKQFDTDDREFAYGVLRAWLHTLRDRLTVEAAAHFAAQLPDLIWGVFYAGCNPSAVPLKYNAEAYAVRFAREANISLQDVGKEGLRRSPPPYCTSSRLPRCTRSWISFPAKSASYCNPCGHLGRPRDDEFITGRVIAGSEHLSCERLASATTFRGHRELDRGSVPEVNGVGCPK